MPRTVPTMGQAFPGNFETAAFWNANVKAAGDFLTAVPVFRGYQSTAQSCASGTWVSVNIDTETLDSDGGHSTVSNTNRYTPSVPGTYLVMGTVAFSGNATGVRACRITLGGNPIVGAAAAGTTNTSWWCATAMDIVVCNGSTDWVEVQARQDSGGSMSTYTGTDFNCSLRVFWVSR